jgi:hypothetical protein
VFCTLGVAEQFSFETGENASGHNAYPLCIKITAPAINRLSSIK